MRSLIGSAVLLFVLGLVRLTGCGEEPQGRPCERSLDCDDQNPCTQDLCPAGSCWYQPGSNGNLCDYDGVKDIYEDGVCAAGVCEKRWAGCRGDYDCQDRLCSAGYDFCFNTCTRNACDPSTGQCVYTPKPDGTACCFEFETYNCAITVPCSTRCTGYGTCQNGKCCEGGDCLGYPPPSRVPCNPDSQTASPCPMGELEDWLCCPGNEYCRPDC